MNEILILKRKNNNTDDGIFTCYNGVTLRQSGYEEESTALFWEGNRAEGFISSFLRATNKAVEDYDSTEEVIRDFLQYCQNVKNIGE